MRHLLFACAALGLACSDGPITPSDPMAELKGSWTLQTWELREVGNPTNARNMVEEGFTATLVVDAAGATTLSLSFQNQLQSSQTGTLAIRGDTLVYHTEDGEFLLKYSSVGGIMTWDTIEPELADLDGDDVPESFVEHLVFRRS